MTRAIPAKDSVIIALYPPSGKATDKRYFAIPKTGGQRVTIAVRPDAAITGFDSLVIELKRAGATEVVPKPPELKTRKLIYTTGSPIEIPNWYNWLER